ncbi:MAG: hypothetical protein NZ805_15935, partial [Armatimonadetes bacterium]|nr:hypothetical protein [Armatimonadota bacterium]MDW8029999.1 hypothetical protein [Armatimonadota bacterium]
DTVVFWLLSALFDVQERMGALVVKAFEKKEKANAIENKATAYLEQRLRERSGDISSHRLKPIT